MKHEPITKPSMPPQINQEYLVELEGDDDAEAEREPEGRVEQEECLPPALAPVLGQPRAPPPRASAATPGLRPRRRPSRGCERRREENPVRCADGRRRKRARARERAGDAPAIWRLVPSRAGRRPRKKESDRIRVGERQRLHCV